MPVFDYVIVTVIIAAASALQAGTGMGMALLAAPLLILVDPALVPGPMLCAVVVSVGGRSAGVNVPRSIATFLASLSSALSSAASPGRGVLHLLAGIRLAPIFACVILATIALSVIGPRVSATRPALLIGGAAAGVVGTMFGVHGPPIAIVLQHEPPDRLRATLCAFFAVGCVISLLALGFIGDFSIGQMTVGLAMLPGVAIGFACAPLLSRVMTRRRARIAVLTTSTLSALALLSR